MPPSCWECSTCVRFWSITLLRWANNLRNLCTQQPLMRLALNRLWCHINPSEAGNLSSLWHSEHRPEITLRQHHVTATGVLCFNYARSVQSAYFANLLTTLGRFRLFCFAIKKTCLLPEALDQFQSVRQVRFVKHVGAVLPQLPTNVEAVIWWHRTEAKFLSSHQTMQQVSAG